jgi:hypothetical protein
MPKLARLAAVTLLLLPCLSRAAKEPRPLAPAGQSAPPAPGEIILLPQPNGSQVPISRAEFITALRELVAGQHLSQRLPQQEPRVVPASRNDPGPSLAEMVRHYNLWCQRRHESDDCLGLLSGGRQYLGPEERRTLAVHLALGVVRDEMLESLRNEANPEKVVALLGTYVAGYLFLLAFPEPTSKVTAALISAGLLGYVGAWGVIEIVEGYLQLREEAVEASTFAELRQTGEHFGKVLGANGARALVMLVTWGIGKGADLMSKLTRLPGIGLATQRLAIASGGRLQLGALRQVEAEVVVGSRQVTVALKPAVEAARDLTVAMAANGGRGTGPSPKSSSPKSNPPKKGPGKWGAPETQAKGRAAVYQEQRTLHPAKEVYWVNGVEFDGYNEAEGVLIEAKGEGYERFFGDNLQPKHWYMRSAEKKIFAQAKRQNDAARAAGNVPIRWEVAEEKAAAAFRELFKDRFKLIKVIHVPMRK